MSDEQRRWDNEVTGILAFVEKVRLQTTGPAGAWALKMVGHYILRLRKLLTNIPRGLDRRARFYKRVLRALEQEQGA